MAPGEPKRAGAMETAPSAIASATILAAGGLGLVFGQAEHTHTCRSSSDKKFEGGDLDLTNTQALVRPTTSAVDGHINSSPPDPLPFSNPDLPPSAHRNSIGKRGSSFGSFRLRRNSAAPVFEGVPTGEIKESVSSRPSWLRRLSSIPNSQTTSPRSSIAPDSPSFSHGSAAPILDSNSSPIELPPNKLVKRPTTRQLSNGTPGSDKELLPSLSLRRPATSHQRRATLQNSFNLDGFTTPKDPSSPFSLLSPCVQQSPEELGFLHLNSEQVHWGQHFVARTSTRDRSRTDGSLHPLDTATKRIHTRRNTPPVLVTAKMIANQVDTTIAEEDHMHESGAQATMSSSKENSPGELADEVISSKLRRNVSRHFSPPPFKGLRSGTIGRRKRLSMDIPDSAQNAPGPATAAVHIPQHQTIAEQHGSEKQLIASRDDGDQSLVSNTSSRPARKRNSSSPLPPLTRISSFALDLSQIGSSSSSPSSSPLGNIAMQENNIVPMQYPVPNQSTQHGSSPPISATTHSKSYRAPEVAPSDRTSTLVGSDNEIRGFYSGEDEDTDFQSDTIFDSFRTGTTGSLRIQNPLESMFDTSPSSSLSQDKMVSLRNTAVHGSFHEDSNTSEDEFAPTPIKNDQSYEDGLSISTDSQQQISPGEVSQMPALSQLSAIEDFGRLSLEDDDDDEDWAREFEEFGVSNSLSPPSSSLNSRHVSPKSRGALADLTNGNSPNQSPTRLYSRLAQWAEPPPQKIRRDGILVRPKTEHGLQRKDATDALQKHPSMLLRTHSVPIAGEDVQAESVVPTKNGEDMEELELWEGDFLDGDVPEFHKVMPPAIQGQQEQIRVHQGLLREFKSNDEDLQELWNRAEKMNIVKGPSAYLWEEARGMIELAAPEGVKPKPNRKDQDQAASPSSSPTTIEFDHDTVDERFRDIGFDGEDLDRPDEVSNAKSVTETTTVRRQSVFLPDDDIFGHSTDMNVTVEISKSSPYQDDFTEKSPDGKPSKPATFPRMFGKDAAAFARSAMESIHQQRSISDPFHFDSAKSQHSGMQFDVVTLRDLVTRGNHLIKKLTEVVTASECVQQSPQRTESPAFTRVFTDHLASPPRRLPRTKSAISNMGGSADSSPTKIHSKRIQVTRVK